MTPPLLARRLVSDLDLNSNVRILEPSFGDGSFLIPLIEHLMSLRTGTRQQRFRSVMKEQVYGVELDEDLHRQALDQLANVFGPLPAEHNLVCGDYFRVGPLLDKGFDVIVGNPPFGGTFDADIEDALDRRYGSYGGHKLKKETYSFFVAKAIEELSATGRLRFICSDTFLTINTMRGLRELLLDSGTVTVSDLPGSFDTTKQPMVVLDLTRGQCAEIALIRGEHLPRATIESTPNFSWGLSPEMAPLFGGPLLGDYLVATGGMTIGRNKLFVREIQPDGTILEHHDFEFFERPVTLARERERARLNRLSEQQATRVRRQEEEGVTSRAVRVSQRGTPNRVKLPHPDYLPYNRASSSRLFSHPTHAIYWRNDGEAVLTFKRDGPWYLHGVGGKPFFKREGLTWQLVSPRINARYLPAGYILDSGAPCAFLRDGIDAGELFVILAWLQTSLATKVLKSVVNHTRNIQGKDIERLPYPVWTSLDARRRAARLVKAAIVTLMAREPVDPSLWDQLDELFQPTEALQVAA